MRNYRITFYNNCTGEIFAIMELGRENLTSREFKMITKELFFEAARGGCTSNYLTAEVYEIGIDDLNAKLLMEVECCTETVDGCGMQETKIVSTILAGNGMKETEPVRRMVLAA